MTRPLSPILQKKNHSFGEYFSFETTIASNHLKVLNTSVFSESKIFSRYFKNNAMPTGALLFCPLRVVPLWLTV
jgi:hypothetical protein